MRERSWKKKERKKEKGNELKEVRGKENK